QVKPRELERARWMRREVGRRLTAALESVDVIVSPTTTGVATEYPDDALSDGEIDDHLFAGRVAFTYAANLAGLPAVQGPCGFVDGLPVGLQLMGPPGAEARLLSLAAEVERATAVPRAGAWDLLGQPD